MKDFIFDDFQNIVSESLVRHKSIIDIMSKLQESQAKINRAIAKSVTSCGCLEINAKKQQLPSEIPDNMTLEDFNKCMNSHVHGKLCDNCRDILEKELGSCLFYITSLCDTLDISLYDVLLKEYAQVKMLGKYHMR